MRVLRLNPDLARGPESRPSFYYEVVTMTPDEAGAELVRIFSGPQPPSGI
jgi:hypothetical protein